MFGFPTGCFRNIARLKNILTRFKKNCMGETKGYVSQVIGPVVDIHFDNEKEEKIVLPRIHDAMEITRPNGKILIVEVQQHIGGKHSPYSRYGYDRRTATRNGSRIMRFAHYHAGRRSGKGAFDERDRRSDRRDENAG